MKIKSIYIITAVLFAVYGLSARNAHSVNSTGAEADLTLKQIAQSIKKYAGSEITMILRLKRLDTVFEKIIFYDANNHNIVFDISDESNKKKMKPIQKDLHPGMKYRIKFKVISSSIEEPVSGELHEFRPYVLDKLPY